MTPSDSPEKICMDSALLLVSRKPKCLAALFTRFFPTPELQELARSVGQRRPGRPDPAFQVADAIPRLPKLRQTCVEELLKRLDSPGPKITRQQWQDADPASFSEEAQAATLLPLLTSPEEANWQLALDLLEQWGEFFLNHPCRKSGTKPPVQPTPPPNSPSASHSRVNSPNQAARLRKKEQKIQEQLLEARREVAEIQDRLSAERQRKSHLQEQLEEANGLVQHERMRATELKRRLLATSSSSEREQLLESEAERCHRQASILEQKFQMVAEERDDLRGVLEDHDRFTIDAEEEVASFRNRPLTQSEQALAARLEDRSGAKFQILVVGGGKPQHKHRDKLAEYSDVMGFSSHWRMAEYQSWHKEMETLARDMRSRFHALIILHWNRTTFSRKARVICDKDGAKPCLTCHYEGFTNLRESLQSCLNQLLLAETRS